MKHLKKNSDRRLLFYLFFIKFFTLYNVSSEQEVSNFGYLQNSSLLPEKLYQLDFKYLDLATSTNLLPINLNTTLTATTSFKKVSTIPVEILAFTAGLNFPNVNLNPVYIK